MKRTGLECTAILALSLALWISDAALSMRLGVLANPQLYDGLSYRLQARLGPVTQMVNSSEDLPHVRQAMATPSILTAAIPQLGWFAVHAPLWTALIALAEQVGGSGDLQADSVRIWQTFILLASVFFASRPVVGTTSAWAMLLIAGAFPAVSVSAKAAFYERLVSGIVDFGAEWFLADLRPDTLLGVLLFSANLSFWNFLKDQQIRSVYLLGIFIGLAIITKPSVSPVVIITAACMMLITPIYLKLDIRRYRIHIILSLSVMIAIVMPYILTGGFINTAKYIINATIISGELWGTTFGTRSIIDALYSLRYTINTRFGYTFWFVFALCIFSQFLVKSKAERIRRIKEVSPILLMAILGIICSLIFRGINASIGFSSILSIWFAMSLIFFKNWQLNVSGIKYMHTPIIILSVSYMIVLYIGAWYAYYTWPEYGKSVGSMNRMSEDRLKNDIKAIIDDSHIVTSVEIWGFPLSLVYDTLTNPQVIVNTSLYSMSMAGLTTGEVAHHIMHACYKCSPIILLDTDNLMMSPHMSSRPIIWPYIEEISRQVKREDSQYILARSYPIAPTGLTSMESTPVGKYAPNLLLFIRNDMGEPVDLGFTDKHDGILYDGSNWSLPVADTFGRFRVARDGAKIILSRSIYSHIIFDVEPSRLVNGNPLELSAVFSDGSIHRLGNVDGRRHYALHLPSGRSGPKEAIQLSIVNPSPANKNADVASDIRVLDIRWGDLSDVRAGAPEDLERDRGVDIVDGFGDVGIYVGDGWYDLEHFDGETFRWVNEYAIIELVNGSGADRMVEIELEVEPGPSLGSREMDLIVATSGGQPLPSIRVGGRQKVRFKVEVPAYPGVERVQIGTRGRGVAVPNDPRTLNFRVFSVRRVGP